jgi:hypothetical protein
MSKPRIPYGGGLPPAPAGITPAERVEAARHRYYTESKAARELNRQPVANQVEPTRPLDCNHQNLLVMSSRAMGTDDNSHRYEVRLCRVCGHFSVWGEQNGEHFDFGFELVRDEYIEAAGRYIEYLNLAEARRVVGR